MTTAIIHMAKIRLYCKSFATKCYDCQYLYIFSSRCIVISYVSKYIPLYFRGLYVVEHSFGPVYLPAGQYPIKFDSIAITNDRICIDDQTNLEKCLVDDRQKFRAPWPRSWYHFEIGAHAWNDYGTGNSFWIDISVKGQIEPNPPVLLREFKDYSPFYNLYNEGGRRYVVFKFDLYMPKGMKCWLENNKIHTLITGPDEFKFTWMAYVYSQ